MHVTGSSYLSTSSRSKSDIHCRSHFGDTSAQIALIEGMSAVEQLYLCSLSLTQHCCVGIPPQCHRYGRIPSQNQPWYSFGFHSSDRLVISNFSM